MKVDDFGRFHANAKLLRSALYPLKEDMKSSMIDELLQECLNAGLIIVYKIDEKWYLQIQEFNQQIRTQKAKFPDPADGEQLHINCTSIDMQKYIPVVNDDTKPLKSKELEKMHSNCISDDAQLHTGCMPETETETEKENTFPDSNESGSLISYSTVKEKTKGSISKFIQANKPFDIQPYVDLWNIFALEKGTPQVKTISSTRKRKIKVRVREKNFDFVSILANASKSDFLLKSNWFTFDWIIENDVNYMKVIEGNYKNKTNNETKPTIDHREETGRNILNSLQ